MDITIRKCGRPTAGAAFLAGYNTTGSVVNRFEDFCPYRCPAYANNSKIPEEQRRTEYMRYVLASRYGFSPPGMGYDCYRTWEVCWEHAAPRCLVPQSHFTLSALTLRDDAIGYHVNICLLMYTYGVCVRVIA